MTFPSLLELFEAALSEEDVSDTVTEIIEEIQQSSFQRWYRFQEFEENIRNGQAYFNTPRSSVTPLRHRPSQLLECHRKIYYRQHKAPKESSNPLGIFWVGENVETELIVPFFQDLVSERYYVQNSIWIDFTIQSRNGELHFKGETDPVFVDVDGIPLVPTEIKTKDSIDQLESPDDRHLAQAHAYMYGLTEKYERRITDVLLVYIGRSNLDCKIFHREFDPLFWRESVLDWAATQSKHRAEERLPPADPQQKWECKYCSYRQRCGMGTDELNEDSPPPGFVPLHEYPEEMVLRHLQAYSEKHILLTPTLAHQHPQLTNEYGIYDWHCFDCQNQFNWESIDSGSPGKLRRCPKCKHGDDGERSVRGPTPEEQLREIHE